MKKKIFISYDFNDASHKGEAEKWLRQSGKEIISKNRKEVDPKTDREAQREILSQIDGVDAVIVLVGNNTHNRPWVDYEVAVTKSKQIPIYCIRLSQRNGAPPSEIKGVNCIDFNEVNIKNLIK